MCLGQKSRQLSLQLSSETLSKVGLAIIVSNDYSDNETGLAKLHGCHKDADRVYTTLVNLGYEVAQYKNVTYFDLTCILAKAATLPHIPSCECLVFVYCGYGVPLENSIDTGGKIYNQEGTTFSLAEILNSKIITSYNYPKLLFFNLCKDLTLESVWLSRVEFLNLEQFPKKDNLLIASSMLPYKELQLGNLWIELLSKAFQKCDDDITFILNDVSNTLSELYSFLPLFAVSQFVDMLTKPFSFLSGLHLG